MPDRKCSRIPPDATNCPIIKKNIQQADSIGPSVEKVLMATCSLSGMTATGSRQKRVAGDWQVVDTAQGNRAAGWVKVSVERALYIRFPAGSRVNDLGIWRRAGVFLIATMVGLEESGV